MKSHLLLVLAALSPAVCATAVRAPVAVAQPAAPARSADDAYRAAYALVLGERWADAERALGAFLTAHGSAEKADDAGFWRCYAVEKQGRAREAFGCYNGFVAAHPDTPWRDDSQGRLIGLASALAPGQAVTVYGTACNVPGVVCEPAASGGQGTATYYPRSNVDRTPPPAQAPATTVWHAATAPAEYAAASADYAGFLRQQRANPDERVAILAVQALAQPGRDDVVEDLRRLAVESASEAVRGVAAGGLARVGTPNARAALASLVEAALAEAAAGGAGGPAAERRAIDLIGDAVRRGDATLAPTLDRALRNDRLGASVRERAAGGLGQIGTDTAVGALLAFVEDDRAPLGLRTAALRSFDVRAAAGQAARLLALFERTREPDLRGALARALSEIASQRSWGTQAALGQLNFSSVDFQRVDFPRQLDFPERFNVPNASAPLPSVTTRPIRRAAPDTVAIARVRAALLATLETDDTPDVHRAALHVLSFRAAPGDVGRLERFALRTDASEDLRASAVERIARADVPEAFGALRRLAERLDGRPLATVAYSFGTTFRTNPEGIPVLARLARHDDAAVRAAAIDALGRIEAPAARQALLDLIRGGG